MPKVLGACCALMLSSSLFVATNVHAKEKPKPPGVKLELNNTPLQQSFSKIQSKLDAKLERAKNHPDPDKKDKCLKALSETDPEKQTRAVAKFCDVMQTKKSKEPSQELLADHHGKKIGKKIKTEHTIYLGHPRNRYIDDDAPPNVDPNHWDDVKYTGRPSSKLLGIDPKHHPSSISVRNAVLPASDATNDDRDCIDLVTRKHLGGKNIPDGDANSCFESSGVLKVTLEFDPVDKTCQHIATAKNFSAEQCEAFGATSLQELIDEDGGGPGSFNKDDDLDGQIDEDGPALDQANNPCDLEGGVRDPNTDACDFTAKIRKHVQDQLKDQDKVKFFKTTPTGECDPTDTEGEYPCGEEPREVIVEETLAIRCPPNAEYVEDDTDGVGRCKIPVKENQPLAAASVFDTTRKITPDAMMGFTFAPPVLEWGINERWRVCFIFCVEVFSIRFGYEFDVAAGLRLPVRVTVDGIPDQALAGQQRTLNASMEPLDYLVKDYTNFCEINNLDDEWWISDCDRFAFPEFLESMLPDTLFPYADKQGSEFVAHASAFAGLQIKVLSIPVVNYAIDSSVDLPAMCTINNIVKQVTENKAGDWLQFLYTFGENLENPQNVLDAKKFLKSLQSTFTNCGSFTTPWGYDEDGNLRQFPFLSSSIEIPANCIDAKIQSIGSQGMTMCTGLALNLYGASLGLGLQLVPEAGSKNVVTSVAATGDANLQSTSPIHFNPDDPPPSMSVLYDNYDPATDSAVVSLDDFVYHLDTFGVQVNGLIELGGILSFIGNIATIPLIHVSFTSDGFYIPIPQHPGTGPIDITVPVTNYALSINGVPDDPLPIEPGKRGVFEVQVTNQGSAVDTFDNFKFELSNHPVTGAEYAFGINKNNDFDCESLTLPKVHYRGYPYDGVADDCYDAAGTPRTDRKQLEDEDGSIPGSGDTVEARDDDKDGLADEDPVDVWTASFANTPIASVPAHKTADQVALLSVVPFKHALTKPGEYPVRITADSSNAKLNGLTDDDPLHFKRVGATDVVTIRVESFVDPKVVVYLDKDAKGSVKPGESSVFVVEAENGGNVPDQIAVRSAFLDSDLSNCSLTRNGQSVDCPYRALHTSINPAWTNVAQLATLFPASGQFQSLENGKDKLTINVPLDWAGMQDTVYDFTMTATSTADPKASKEFLAHFTITATKRSMMHYLNLEITEFMAEIDKANAAGTKSRGIQPVMLHPITMMTTKALEQTIAGDLSSASKSLSSATKVMEAVARMVSGAGLPEPLASDWNARSAAILTDMAKAQASMVQ